MNKELRISCDIDDTLVDWIGAHCKKFKINSLDEIPDHKITKQVNKCRLDKEFWENLELIEMPDFIPINYCTKRINSKIYTRNNFKKLGLPIRPIYQIYSQPRSKAELIKGRCDILIDDSYSNVLQCIRDGVPALLIDRPHNRHIDTPYRIYKLNYKEIKDKYDQLEFGGIKKRSTNDTSL